MNADLSIRHANEYRCTVTDNTYSVAIYLDNPQDLMARRNIFMRVGTALIAPYIIHLAVGLLPLPLVFRFLMIVNEAAATLSLSRVI